MSMAVVYRYGYETRDRFFLLSILIYWYITSAIILYNAIQTIVLHKPLF